MIRPAARNKAFTLVELMTVAFILALLMAVLLPAIQQFLKNANVVKTGHVIGVIRIGVMNYRQDFGDYPPSEANPYGGDAIFDYLNGTDGNGYVVGYGSYSGNKRVWPPRVNGVPLVTTGTPPAPKGFADAWGNEIQYFRAYTRRQTWTDNKATWLVNTSASPRPLPGRVVADLYPRAVNVNTNLSGGSFSAYPSGSGTAYSINVAVSEWLGGVSTYTWSTPFNVAIDWRFNALPANADFLIVSSGQDQTFGVVNGTTDDIGDVQKTQNN